MNWYKLFKLSFNRTKSQNLSSKLSRDIFDIIQNNTEKKNVKTTISVDNQCKLFLTVNYVKENSLENRYIFNKNFKIRGYSRLSKFKILPPQIHITIIMNSLFSKNNYERFYRDIHEVIKHETWHYFEYLYPNHPQNQDENTLSYGQNILENYVELKSYILDEKELEALTSGMVFKAQKQRITFNTVMEERLDELFFESNSTKKNEVLNSSIGKEVEKILFEVKNSILSKAKKMYPNTKL